MKQNWCKLEKKIKPKILAGTVNYCTAYHIWPLAWPEISWKKEFSRAQALKDGGDHSFHCLCTEDTKPEKSIPGPSLLTQGKYHFEMAASIRQPSFLVPVQPDNVNVGHMDSRLSGQTYHTVERAISDSLKRKLLSWSHTRHLLVKLSFYEELADPSKVLRLSKHCSSSRGLLFLYTWAPALGTLLRTTFSLTHSKGQRLWTEREKKGEWNTLRFRCLFLEKLRPPF